MRLRKTEDFEAPEPLNPLEVDVADPAPVEVDLDNRAGLVPGERPALGVNPFGDPCFVRRGCRDRIQDAESCERSQPRNTCHGRATCGAWAGQSPGPKRFRTAAGPL